MCAQARYRARKTLQTKLRSCELGRKVAKAVWHRCGKEHATFMEDMRDIIKAVHYSPTFKRSLNGVLDLPAKRSELLAKRKPAEPFIITVSKQEQMQQAMAMEIGRNGKGGFVAH